MMVDPLAKLFRTGQALLQFFDDVEREVVAVPGVRSVGWASTLPYGESMFGRLFFEVVGEAAPDESRRPSADYQIVSPGYFGTLDLPLVSGRNFDEHDTGERPPVCMVNEAFVPITCRVGARRHTDRDEVVSVGAGAGRRPRDRRRGPPGQGPSRRNRGPAAGLRADRAEPGRRHLHARCTGFGTRRGADRTRSRRDRPRRQGPARRRPLRHDARGRGMGSDRPASLQGGARGHLRGLALLLAMVGIFGVLAYTVQQRVRDLVCVGRWAPRRPTSFASSLATRCA